MNTDLSPDAARFLPLVKTLAEQAQEEIAPHVSGDQILDWAKSSLNKAFSGFRSRQGATLRTYLTYRIRAAIYHHLQTSRWPSSDAEKRYRFAKKSNELLLHFTISAEGAVKRSTRMEEEQMMEILRLLVIVGLLIWKNVPRGEIQRQWDLTLASLDSQQKHFLQEYYEEDRSLDSTKGMTTAEAFRYHLRILQTLARGLKQV